MTSRVALETAREQVAGLLGARPREVVFTSGATESIAAATHGARTAHDGAAHVVSTAVEHSAVLRWAERGPHTVVAVDGHGRVDPDDLMGAVRDDTALVHLQSANHEVGTHQPVEEVVPACRERGVPVHVDAAQSLADLPRVVDLGADLTSVSGHKLGAPAGIGLLVVRRGLRVQPLLVGGDQERARRAGLENVAAAMGLAAATDELAERGAGELDHHGRLTEAIRSWAERAEGVEVLGHPEHRIPHLVCLALAGVEPQPVLLGLDQRGVAVHSGSSCSSEALEPSPVLAAMGVDAQRSLRLSVGHDTTAEDVTTALGHLDEVLAGLRALGAPR